MEIGKAGRRKDPALPFEKEKGRGILRHFGYAPLDKLGVFASLRQCRLRSLRLRSLRLAPFGCAPFDSLRSLRVFDRVCATLRQGLPLRCDRVFDGIFDGVNMKERPTTN